MTSMVRLRLHRDKRLPACCIVPVCLFLIFLGIRVPDLTRLHSSPKPTPRAVIETANKAGKLSIAKHVIAVELFDSAPELPAPELFPSSFPPASYRFSTTTPPQDSARAPPAFAC